MQAERGVPAVGLRRRRKLIVVVALIGGLVGMHHLAGGGHHGTHGAVVHSSSGGLHVPLDSAAAWVTRSLTQDENAPAGICLAVVLGGLVLLLGAGRAPYPAWRRPTPLGSVRSARRGRGPPRRLLAEICVLRT